MLTTYVQLVYYFMFRIAPQIFAALITFAVSPPVWSDSEGYFFDCDVPAGNFSEWHGPIELAETIRISGTIEVVKLRHDKRWWPVGSIFLRNLGGESIGLQVYVDWRDTDTFLLGLFSGERKLLAEIPLTDEYIPFEFSLTRAGVLTATIAKHSESAEIDGFDAQRLALSCSSGQFKFRDIHVQYE